MEKKDDDKDIKDTEKMKSLLDQMAKDKNPVAKDLVELKHVETKVQEVSQETLNLAQTLKGKVLEHDKFEELSNDELTILEAFQGRRLFLSRIAIIVNQSRIPMGIPGLKKQELEDLTDSLCKKGYLESQQVGDQMVFFLTERGKYRVQ
jgi:hypothetical protein